MKYIDNEKIKAVESEDYNYIFRKSDGFFARWGRTKEDNPLYAPTPEILDIEITERCSGVPNKDGIRIPCSFCYKSNTPDGQVMSFNNFKQIIDKMPWLTQCALGADSTGTSNPDMFRMMHYARSNGIIPNLTIADVSDEIADELVKVCGAVAVSRYENKDICYNSIKKLSDRGLKQTNMHMLIAKETKEQVYETFNDIKRDDRLKGMNAIVLLSLKQKNRGEKFTPLTQEEFNSTVSKGLELNMPLGFDSCGSCKFMNFISDHPDREKFEKFVEPCESTLFSSYISVDSKFYPCSFMEGTGDWKDGIEIKQDTDFIKDIWNHPKTIEFRNKLLTNGRNCPIYNI